MKLLAVLAASISILAAQENPVAVRTVTAVRCWAVGDVTRVAIEVTGDFEVRSDRLHNPERVYYDILRARPLIESRRIYSRTLDDKLVKRIRVAETHPGITRVVLDLNGELESTSSMLTHPSRLIVELRAASSAPAAAPADPAAPSVTSAPAQPAATPLTRQNPPKVESPLPLKAAPNPPMKAEVPENVVAEPSKAQMAKADPPVPPAPAAPAPLMAPAPRQPAPAAAGPEEIGKAARHTSAGESSLVRTLGLKLSRVVIDAGHGGHDQGTEGPHGLLEKDLVLDVALRLGKMVESRLGAEVIYTRSDDTFIPLEGRTALANEKKADLFLSIHANSSTLHNIAGIETYYLNIKGSSKDALDVAARENASSQKSIFELQDLIQKIAKYDKAEESREFAGRVQAALYAFSSRSVAGSRNRGVRTAPFVVLIGANMPSVLAEIGFLSNPREEALLKKPDYREKLAEALYRGVSRYADSLSHFQVAQAQQ
jgi:N-acetylmuramoyl-L-alanine amidase